MNEDPIIQDALAGNVLLYVKTPDSTGFTQEHDVYLYPTFLILNSDAEALYTWIGWPGSETWVEQMHVAKRDPVTIEERRTRFGSEPVFTDAYALGTIEYARRNTRVAHDYLREAMNLDETAARLKDVPILLFNTAYRGVGNGDFTPEECAAVAEEIMGDERVKTEDALQITARLVRAADDIGEEQVVRFLQMAHPIVEADDSEELRMRRHVFFADYAMIVEKDAAGAVKFKRLTMPEGWMDDTRHLNSFAWWCFENEVNLEEAEELSRRSIEIAEDAGQKANCLDTLAEIVNLRGDTAAALDLIKQGLELDPDNEYLRKQRLRFEEAMATTT